MVRGFVVVVVFSISKCFVVSVVGGCFSSVDPAADDVRAFIVLG